MHLMIPLLLVAVGSVAHSSPVAAALEKNGRGEAFVGVIDPPPEIKNSSHAFFAELGGPHIAYSVGYDYRFSYFSVTGRASVLPLVEDLDLWLLSLSAQMHTTQLKDSNHSFFLGPGILVEPTDPDFAAVINVGYEYRDGFFFRASSLAMYDFSATDPEIEFWAGVAFGFELR